jgi:putative NIF3 family GTP cyclohydrolase 1 type 2
VYLSDLAVTRNSFLTICTAHSYPEELADRAWDNVGLLLENSKLPTNMTGRERVLLTNDLTPDVVDEAIAYKVSVIVAYRQFPWPCPLVI